ncbi:MAG: TRAP transporter small permease, partial [Thermoanaerobaculia bacterium]
MSCAAVSAPDNFAVSAPRRQVFALGEELLLAAVLGAMILLPIAEIAMRFLGKSGLSGSTTIVQHCTLVLSMVGAAIAARHSRLLSIGTSSFLPERVKRAAVPIASTGAAAVAAVLSAASFRFVMTERSSAKMLAWHLPVWIIESALPLGFAIIAF